MLLSIVLPLKGRPLHTLRFLWHANQIRLPYPILIADGMVKEGVSRLIEDHSTFPNLAIEYHRYPDDVSFGHFYRKLADIMRKVRTPYVKMVDNDDFIGVAALDKCVEFLEGHPDYVCCGGGIAGFALDEMSGTDIPLVVGRINRFNYRYTD